MTVKMYTIAVRMFVQFMHRNDLIICAFRVNMCTAEREITKTEENTMTRFEREISGSLGAFWKKNAEEEVRKASGGTGRHAGDSRCGRRNQMEQ